MRPLKPQFPENTADFAFTDNAVRSYLTLQPSASLDIGTMQFLRPVPSWHPRCGVPADLTEAHVLSPKLSTSFSTDGACEPTAIHMQSCGAEWQAAVSTLLHQMLFHVKHRRQGPGCGIDGMYLPVPTASQAASTVVGRHGGTLAPSMVRTGTKLPDSLEPSRGSGHNALSSLLQCTSARCAEYSAELQPGERHRLGTCKASRQTSSRRADVGQTGSP